MPEFEKVIASPLGELTLESDGECVTALRFGNWFRGGRSCAVLEQAAAELEEYFARDRHEFTVPVKAEGTAFQRSVWTQLREIPYGKTVSYRTIAERLGKSNACRAVGGANHRNPVPILIPCHRVVGKNGTLTGYAGGLRIKEYLLRLERIES